MKIEFGFKRAAPAEKLFLHRALVKISAAGSIFFAMLLAWAVLRQSPFGEILFALATILFGLGTGVVWRRMRRHETIIADLWNGPPSSLA